MATQSYQKILQTLVDHRVEFIVVGCPAVLNGAPINTLDVDVVHSTGFSPSANSGPTLRIS